MRVFVISAITLGFLAVVSQASETVAPLRSQPSSTEALYNRLCLACHGEKGDGRGPASPWLSPTPRDFTKGHYKWRSTPSGSPPTDKDLALTIRLGVTGTSMHGFGDYLTASQVNDLVDHVKSFASPKFFNREKTLVNVPETPKVTKKLLERGAQQFVALGCASCHGKKGDGNGPASKTLKRSEKAALYNLNKTILRRPHQPGQELRATFTSIVTGLSGTPMPSYDGAAEPNDLWALSAFTASLMPNKSAKAGQNGSISVARHLRVGKQPPSKAATSFFRKIIVPQGKPPSQLAPAQASLSAKQCGRCHAKQKREWQGSFHGRAGSPGLIAQLLPRENPHGAAFVGSCQRCHAPLAEQTPFLPGGKKGPQPNAAFRSDLREEGINCAGCHVRKWTRQGPVRNPGSGLLPLEGYPVKEMEIYERSDFCIDCHQLGPKTAVNGKPRLNTYREWLEGPYMRRGIQCQHCHMPNREHTWKGVHDKETFSQGITVLGSMKRDRKNNVVAKISVTNSGAGHYLPTTPTPAAWIIAELLDDDGDVLETKKKRIGWHLVFTNGKWKEIEDTRIPPGESLLFTPFFRSKRATHVRVSIFVSPDDFYEGFYLQTLKNKHAARERTMFEIALARTRDAKYTAYRRLFPIR